MEGRTWEALALAFERRFAIPHRGLRELTELRATLDRIEGELVVVARRNQSSWQEIGSSLGISRQAARERHRHFVNRAAGDCPRPFG